MRLSFLWKSPCNTAIYICETKREEILYKNFVAKCKAKTEICLHGAEIESTHLQTQQLKNL